MKGVKMPKSTTPRQRLRRLCADCNEKFYPTGKFAKLCFKCLYNKRGRK